MERRKPSEQKCVKILDELCSSLKTLKADAYVIQNSLIKGIGSRRHFLSWFFSKRYFIGTIKVIGKNFIYINVFEDQYDWENKFYAFEFLVPQKDLSRTMTSKTQLKKIGGGIYSKITDIEWEGSIVADHLNSDLSLKEGLIEWLRRGERKSVAIRIIPEASYEYVRISISGIDFTMTPTNLLEPIDIISRYIVKSTASDFGKKHNI